MAVAHALNKLDLFDVVEDDAVEKFDVRCGLYLLKHENHVQWLTSKNHSTVKECNDDRKDNDETVELPIITSENKF